MRPTTDHIQAELLPERMKTLRSNKMKLKRQMPTHPKVDVLSLVMMAKHSASIEACLTNSGEKPIATKPFPPAATEAEIDDAIDAAINRVGAVQNHEGMNILKRYIRQNLAGKRFEGHIVSERLQRKLA